MLYHLKQADEERFAALKSLLSAMVSLAEEQLAWSIEALVKRDSQLADAVIQADDRMDAMAISIDERDALAIANRQPLTTEVRQFIVAIRIASDLEKIGDLAKGIAKRSHDIQNRIPRRLTVRLGRLGQLSRAQLELVLEAFAANDAEKALEVWRRDEELDVLYTSVFRELLTDMMEDPRLISVCAHLLFAAKNLERIGDHATNIAENVYYLVRREPLREARPKKDLTSITAYPLLNGHERVQVLGHGRQVPQPLSEK